MDEYGQPGYSLAPGANGSVQKAGAAKAAAQKPNPKAVPKPSPSKAAPKAASARPSAAKAPHVPLRELVTRVLKKMGTPVKVDAH